jgi:hypothetical protein
MDNKSILESRCYFSLKLHGWVFSHFFPHVVTFKIVDWLLFAIFEERRTKQICCHVAPNSTLAKLFQHATFKTTSLKLATSSRTFTFNSRHVLYFLINLIFSQIGFCNVMSANSSNFWYEMWSSLIGWQTSICRSHIWLCDFMFCNTCILFFELFLCKVLGFFLLQSNDFFLYFLV